MRNRNVTLQRPSRVHTIQRYTSRLSLAYRRVFFFIYIGVLGRRDDGAGFETVELLLDFPLVAVTGVSTYRDSISGQVRYTEQMSEVGEGGG